MNELLSAMTTSPFFGISLSLLGWCVGVWIHKKTKLILLNHMLLAVAFVILFLAVTGIPYESYSIGGNVLKTMLGPVTAVLALNIYNQRKVLKEYFIPVLAGCFAGSATSLGLVLLLCRLLEIEESITMSIMSKSCTTAIAIGIAESHGGVAGIAVGGVMIAGLTGAVLAPFFAKIFRIKNPVAEGLAIGACSHALGTSKAMEFGPVQGAMSSIAICLCGIITSVLVLLL